MHLHQCINFLLSSSQHTVFQHLNSQLSEHQITPAQYGILNVLWEHKTLSPKQICEFLYLEASTVSCILDRMQKNDLITRSIDPQDRRTIVVEATPKGQSLQQPVEVIIDNVNKQFLGLFSEREQQFLQEALLTIARAK